MKPLIAHFGAFDHDSFGDLIFPHLIEHALPEFRFVHVSPSGAATPFVDAVKTISLSEALSRNDFDGVALGGGDLVSCVRWSPPAWEKCESEKDKGSMFSRLWSSPSLLSATKGIPLVWNAPGAPLDGVERKYRAVKRLVDCASYIAVRDVFSQRKIQGLGLSANVCPDTAILLSDMWPVREMRRGVINMCWSAADVSNRESSISSVVKELRRIGYKVSFLPLMRHQGAGCVEGVYDIASGTSLKEIAYAIGSAEGYIGNSLHGLVSTLSYGKKAVIVPPAGRGFEDKYAGFLMACGLDVKEYYAPTWEDAVELFQSQRPVNLGKAKAIVAAHYLKISQVLKTEKRDVGVNGCVQIKKAYEYTTRYIPPCPLQMLLTFLRRAARKIYKMLRLAKFKE